MQLIECLNYIPFWNRWSSISEKCGKYYYIMQFFECHTRVFGMYSIVPIPDICGNYFLGSFISFFLILLILGYGTENKIKKRREIERLKREKIIPYNPFTDFATIKKHKF